MAGPGGIAETTLLTFGGPVAAATASKPKGTGQLVAVASRRFPGEVDLVRVNAEDVTALAAQQAGPTNGQTQGAQTPADAWAMRHSFITARLTEHLQNAVRGANLTPRQIKDIAKNGMASKHWGTQIDTRFKELVQNDMLLQGEVAVSPRSLRGDDGKFRKWPGAPDVVDLRAKRYWDATSTVDEFSKKPPKYDTQYGEGTALPYAEP